MKKKYDCVEMKDAIQRKLRMRRMGKSERDIQAELKQELETSPAPIAQYWRKISDGQVENRNRCMVKC